MENVLRGTFSKQRGLASLRDLLDLAKVEAPGPSPTFTSSHILLIFITISASNYVGRQSLAKQCKLGEGATRTVLKKLTDHGYVGVIRSGCYLTHSGRLLAKAIGDKMSSIVTIPRSSLTVGEHQASLALRGAGGKVGSGIEQRDSAIRVGASGATTYIMRSGKFTIPAGSSNCERDFPDEAWTVLRRELEPKDGDAVILCGAQDEVSARLGALAAATNLF
jgi:hypothetical protein